MKTFWSIFAKKAMEKYAKSITFIDKSYHHFPFLQNVGNIYETNAKRIFQNVKIGCKIPYKTCRLWRLLEPFSENGPKKEPKSIRFFTKSDIGFHQVEKPYKTKGKLMILRVPFRSKSSFWRPCRRKSHRVQKGAQLEVWKFFENLLRNGSSRFDLFHE